MSLKILLFCFVGLAVIAASGARAANPVVVMETSQVACSSPRRRQNWT